MYDSIKDNNYDTNIFVKFYKNTIEYLKSNYNFNILAQAFIYLVLGTIEVCRYSLILYSIYLVSYGKLEVGTIILVYTYYDKIIANFEVVGTINAEYQSFIVSLKRLNKLSDGKL
jgi:ABC-type bacteriocin/lantibiotic exporter with double-glycine peptidase domain